MFKILILQRYYNISDDNTEYAILDRLSFMRFLGLGIHDRVPDAKTIWLFRDRLAKAGLVELLFKLLDRQLSKDGIIVNTGKMVDASFVEVPIQRNSREENEKIKEGEVPEDWSDEKRRQKDTDARWAKHNGKKHFGYKNHVKADTKTKLVTAYEVTSANIHDSRVLKNLFEKEDSGQPLYADSAYRSKSLEAYCGRMGMQSRIHEKGFRNKPLKKRQKAANKRKSKVRARVEHIFAFMENSMNGMYLHYRNLGRVTAGIGLMNVTYNLFRLVQIEVTLAR
jgi:IS5 family transposase